MRYDRCEGQKDAGRISGHGRLSAKTQLGTEPGPGKGVHEQINREKGQEKNHKKSYHPDEKKQKMMLFIRKADFFEHVHADFHGFSSGLLLNRELAFHDIVHDAYVREKYGNAENLLATTCLHGMQEI
jgi:hypothetical protein